MKKIGIIGLGNMGSQMSINLLKAGYIVSGFDTNNEAFKKLKKFNILKMKDIKTLTTENDIIITMLPNGEIVEQVWNKILNSAIKGSILIDCSTIDVKTAKKIHFKAMNHQVLSLDAPVSGGVVGAANGTLTFMVGGDEKTYLKAEGVFKILGNKSVHCGPHGSGQAVKICNNMLLAITMIGVGEAFNLGQNLNLDLEKLYDVISTSSGSSWAVNNYCPIPNIGPISPADNNFQAGFSGNLMLKDLSLAIEAIKDTESSAPFGIKAKEMFNKMIDNGNGEYDFSRVIKEIGYD